MSDKIKYGYLAGIIDGEGTLLISRSNRGSYLNYYGRIHVKNTDYRLIKWLVENFGGNVHKNTPTDPEKHAVAYSWYFSGDAHDKEILLLALMPYLIVKREQAKQLVEFFRMSGQVNPNKREELYQRMKVLNRRGPTVETSTQVTEQDSVEDTVQTT